MFMKVDKELHERVSAEITQVIDKMINENPAIYGVTVGTEGGTLIANKFKEYDKIDMNKEQISAATSSLLLLSANLLKGSLDQPISYSLTSGKEKIILSILAKAITLNTYLSREIVSLEGLDNYIIKLKEYAMQISAIIETSEYLKEEIYTKIKRSIPNTLLIAIITKEGLPIKIQSTMPESMMSAMIAALYNTSEMLLQDETLEFSIIGGENVSMIVQVIDEHRILCIAVPEASETKLRSYIARIKSLI